jgi:cytochrome c biogenesis protein CcmG, thiol:disulfide interchange protein DsbE
VKVSWPLVFVSLTVVGALAWVLGKGFGRDPHEVPFMLTGKLAPEFSLERVDAEGTLSLADLQGKPIVLNFWSTWCHPCKAEHPVLEWGHEKFGDKVHFVGVVYQDTRENVDAFLKQTPARWPVLFDRSGRSAVDYGLAGVPETYFITKDGQIHYKHVGPIDPSRLSLHIGELLK